MKTIKAILGIGIGILLGLSLTSCVIEDNGCDTYIQEVVVYEYYDGYGRLIQETERQAVTECYY